MIARLTPYGSGEHVGSIAKVGQKKKTPPDLAMRMPSAEIAAKVGIIEPAIERMHRVVRRNAAR